VILSAGLTPAWQQILVFDAFEPGEVNRAREARWCASGKVFNAGIAVHHLGGASRTLAPVGGPPMEHIDREFQEMGLPFRFIVTRAATRVCTTMIDRRSGTITELVEDGRPLTRFELERFSTAYAEEAAKADAVVLIGSLPIDTPVSFYRDLLEQTPCRAILDFRGEGLLSVLDLKPYVVKPNREELARTVGRPLATDADLCASMQEVNRLGAAWVVVTQGKGPVWVTSESDVYRLDPPPASEVINPIGCGDAMAGAVAWATREGCSAIEAVRLGIAAAGENLAELLPCRLDPNRVQQRAALVRVEQLG
jgi:1-phosphofructokinase family hexose kinase